MNIVLNEVSGGSRISQTGGRTPAPDFGVKPSIYYLTILLSKTAWKWKKEIGPTGGVRIPSAPLDPPIEIYKKDLRWIIDRYSWDKSLYLTVCRLQNTIILWWFKKLTFMNKHFKRKCPKWPSKPIRLASHDSQIASLTMNLIGPGHPVNFTSSMLKKSIVWKLTLPATFKLHFKVAVHHRLDSNQGSDYNAIFVSLVSGIQRPEIKGIKIAT